MWHRERNSESNRFQLVTQHHSVEVCRNGFFDSHFSYSCLAISICNPIPFPKYTCPFPILLRRRCESLAVRSCYIRLISALLKVRISVGIGMDTRTSGAGLWMGIATREWERMGMWYGVQISLATLVSTWTSRLTRSVMRVLLVITRLAEVYAMMTGTLYPPASRYKWSSSAPRCSTRSLLTIGLCFRLPRRTAPGDDHTDLLA